MGIVRSLKPDVVVGFGSYSSFPVVFAASLLRVPAMLHEQNVTPGKANRLSAKFVRRIAVTFEETKKYFRGREIVWTGCPCNAVRPSEARQNLLSRFELRPGRLTILVLGGSQGSRYLNEVFFESIAYLQADQNIQVIHSTGMADQALYAQKYRGTDIPYHVCAFLENIQDAYGAADVVVARSGAVTVCELAAFGLPSVLVPYPFAQSHQTANAQVLEGAGAAVVIEQKDLSCQKLVDAIRYVHKEGLTPSVVRERVGHLFVSNPTEHLVRAVLSLKR
jgi:UDP-N-acetylglucosamine--N-acetylmuramyl-(pentapeptide) pyrophosphoryl-undecaprenol N-acetylglucosamine transferase